MHIYIYIHIVARKNATTYGVPSLQIVETIEATHAVPIGIGPFHCAFSTILYITYKFSDANLKIPSASFAASPLNL